MLSPAATYRAELREQLDSVGRALAAQRGLLWLSRGLAVGTVVVLGLVIWAWSLDTVSALPIVALVSIPIVAALLTAAASMVIRYTSLDLARRVDHAAGLQERSTTALELGARGDEFPLAIAQMRDAVEHLRRVELLEAFPLRAPRRELTAAGFIVVIAAIVAVSPNPWLLRQRASNPTITIAREQAQRVQRLADSIQPNNSAELAALRQLIINGAKTIDARSNEPDAALNALQDLEQQVQQMSAGDDQLSTALAAIASALAQDQTTQPLADAINTGDMRQISQASKDLAQAMSRLSPADQQRVATTLRDAAGKAGRVSQNVANQLSSAANGLDAAAAAAGADAGQAGQAAQAAGQEGANAAQSASDALNQLSNSAAAADARQRAASQLEASRNALERALGRTQSRSGNNTNNSSSNGSSQRSQNGQGAQNGQSGGQSQDGTGQGQNGTQGGGNDPANGGQNSNDGGAGADAGQGGGHSSGGNGQGQNTGQSGTALDPIFDPQQVPNSGNIQPDQSSVNPYTSRAGTGSAQASQESVNPNYSSQPTQGNDSGAIPLGLRDLVKDYFSSLDQK